MKKLEDLIRKYGITKSFLLRYFQHNAENRFSSEMLEFMLWKRGKLLFPKNREKYIRDFLIEEIDNFYQKKELNLPQFQFAVTTRCTLRCRECNFFTPYFDKLESSGDLSFGHFKKEFSNLTGIINTIRRFMILGGEPLLNPALPEILAEACSCGRIPVVEIVTNGTVLPSPELLEVLKKYRDKVWLHISNYAVNQSLLPFLKHENLFTSLKDNGIKYQISSNMRWFREVAPCEHGYSIEQLKTMFNDCWAKRVIQVCNGKVAICPRTSGGYEMNVVPYIEGQYVDLRNTCGETLRQCFIDFFHRDYFDGCKYCVRSEEEVIPALQL